MGTKLKIDFVDTLDDMNTLHNRINLFSEQLKIAKKNFEQNIQAVDANDKMAIVSDCIKGVLDNMDLRIDSILTKTYKLSIPLTENPIVTKYSQVIADSITRLESNHNGELEVGKDYAGAITLVALNKLGIELDDAGKLVDNTGYGKDGTSLVSQVLKYLGTGNYTKAVGERLFIMAMDPTIKNALLSGVDDLTSSLGFKSGSKISGTLLVLSVSISIYGSYKDYEVTGDTQKLVVESLTATVAVVGGYVVGSAAGAFVLTLLPLNASPLVVIAAPVIVATLAGTAITWVVNNLADPINDGIEYLEDEIGYIFEFGIGW